MFQCSKNRPFRHPPLELVEQPQSLKSLHSTDGSCFEFFEAPQRLSDKIPANQFTVIWYAQDYKYRPCINSIHTVFQVILSFPTGAGFSPLREWKWLYQKMDGQQLGVSTEHLLPLKSRPLEDSIAENCTPPKPASSAGIAWDASSLGIHLRGCWEKKSKDHWHVLDRYKRNL